MLLRRSAIFFLKLVVLLPLFTAAVNSAFSQNLSARGRILGAIRNDRNELLVGATIALDGKGISVNSNINGEYEIDVAPGEYSITVSYAGHESKRITGIIVKKGEVSRNDIILEAASRTETEVVVLASAKKETVGSLYRVQRNNIAVSDGISIEQIKRTPDNNVAQSLKRINGVTVLDNKFVVVRGMGERYNNVMLNGSQLPSTEANKKNFSFDLLPSALIDNIVVNKTATPDITAEFAGGVVQVTTKEVPEKNMLYFSAGTGGNTNSTFRDFRSSEISRSEYFGKFDDKRKWFLSKWDPLEYYRARSDVKDRSAAYQMNARIPNNYGLYNYTAAPLQEYQLGGGMRKRFRDNSSFGIVLAGSYRNEQLIEDYTRTTEFGDSVSGRKYGFTTNIGGLASIAYTRNTNKISLKNVYSSRLTHDTYIFSGRDANKNYTSNHGSFLNVNTLIQSRLEGEHALGKTGTKIKWYGDRSETKREQPDTRTTKYFNQSGEGRPSMDIVSVLNPGLGGIYSASLSEKRYGWGADITHPFRLFNQQQKIKGGYSGSERTASFTSVFLRPTLVNGGSKEAAEYFGLPDYKVFTTENFRKGIFFMNPVTTQKNMDADSYSGKQRLTNAYLMADLQLPAGFRLTGGVRLEDYEIGVLNILQRDSLGKVSRDTTNKLEEAKFYPSVNLLYKPHEKMNIRLAYSQTVARFDFREMASVEYFDFFLPGVIFGNSKLKNTAIENYDLRYEFYPSGEEVLSASVFYKKFHDPIEVLQIPNASTIYTYYNFNQLSSTNRGVEVDFRKSFSFINKSSRFLRNLYLSGNFSYIKSEVSIDRNALAKLFAGIIGAPSLDTAKSDTRKRALQGLSPYSINAGLLYQGKDAGFNIVYNKFGRRLVFAGIEAQLDYFENPRDVIDVQLYGRLLKQKMELKLNISDILNQEFIVYNNSNFRNEIGTPNDDPKGDGFNPDKDYILYRGKRGTGISFSVSYRF